MRPRSTHTFLATAAALLTLSACQDESSSLPASPEPPPEPPAATPMQAYAVEGYPEPGELRTGWMYGRDGQPRQVTYEVHGGLAIFEGDIVIGQAATMPATRSELVAAGGPMRGVYIDGGGFRWPGGVVPYEIAGDLPNQARVTNAIAWVEEQTPGVTLVPRDGEGDYIRFVTSDGCSSPIGRQGGQQNINLADGCTTGNTAHEILHALGMFHEHTRCDRDDFVVINWDNIEEGKEHNFEKECDGASDHGEYDEGSIMHYGPFGFSINDQPTIESLRGLDHLMGQRNALGPTDIATIEFLYGVNNVAPVAVIDPLELSYPEGSVVPFTGSNSSDADDNDAILTFAWTFGDGTCAGGTPPSKCSTADPSHIYADDGSYDVTLVVSDGFAQDQALATAVITNVAPVVSAGPDATIDEGDTFLRNGSFTDPGADTWTATVDYDEGAGPEALALAGKTFSLSHLYADDGVHTVTVEVTDDDGGVGSDDVEVTVENVAPIVDAGPDATVTSGETYAFSGSFSDPGVNDAPWAWLITWGDGQDPPTTGGSTSDQSELIEASRQVCTAGEYTVELSVTDKDGGEGTDQLTLSVPYFAVEILIQPGSDPLTPVNLKRGGTLPVAVLSTPDFDATEIDPSTAVLGDETGADTPVAQKNNGTWEAYTEDVNGDGLQDLVLMFQMPALVTAGDLTETTTELVFRAFMADACTHVRGAGAVAVRP
jgi:PKD repeat protein